MDILPVTHPDFAVFGAVLEGIDLSPLLGALASTPRPEAGTVYVPGDPALESLPLAEELQNRLYGGMPVQIGYCNGCNHTLNCLEYHRGSELNIAANPVILLLASLQQVREGKLDTAAVRGFALPAGTGVLLYETALHYAPLCGAGEAGFRVAIVLPRGTNTAAPSLRPRRAEDHMLRAKNKWLLAHPASPEAAEGAFVGLTGDNITFK